MEHFPTSLREDKEVLLYAYMNNADNKNFFPEEIRKEINGNEIVSYLRKSILKEKIFNQLDTNKETTSYKCKI